MSSFNFAQLKPPNLIKCLLWRLQPFLLYQVPFSADIGHAYRRVGEKEELQVFQLLVSFDFTKSDWYNHPIIVRQKTLLYGGILSETILELVIRRAAKSMQNENPNTHYSTNGRLITYSHLQEQWKR